MSPDRLAEPIQIAKRSFWKNVFITRQSVSCVFIQKDDVVWIRCIDGSEWPSKYSLKETVTILKGE